VRPPRNRRRRDGDDEREGELASTGDRNSDDEARLSRHERSRRRCADEDEEQRIADVRRHVDQGSQRQVPGREPEVDCMPGDAVE
jgi:hypothetical protein